MEPTDSPLQLAFREVSLISNATPCSDNKNCADNRKIKGGDHLEDKYIREH